MRSAKPSGWVSYALAWASGLLLATGMAAGCGGSDGASGGSGPSVDAGNLDVVTQDAADAHHEDAGQDVVAAEPTVVLQFGDDIGLFVHNRVAELVNAAATRPVLEIEPEEVPADLHPDSLVLGFGDCATVRSLVPQSESDALVGESMVLRSGKLGDATLLVADGAPPEPDTFGLGNVGASYAAYALLEQLGFAFLHPLSPTVPMGLSTPVEALDLVEGPRWRLRGMQIHTMHPLELTDVLNGWGPGGLDDAQGWSDMLPEWSSYLEWALANRLNRVHWVLLESDSWLDFSRGAARQGRLAKLVDMAHEAGMPVGVDVPISLQQQHAFRLVTETGELDDELFQIRENVDWLMAAGFDYLATESGTSEFTHPEPERMLAWMDEVARHLDEQHDGRRAYMKIHCSSGQVAQGYPDPVTGEDINFNFLPHFADPRLGVQPHTVQHYALDDPAPTYGNTDFGYMADFIRHEAGRREVVWHPETAYWVSFDIDVPLFLPVYAERRVHDLRLLAKDEDEGRMGLGALAGSHMDGQFVFSSGWEWGYWLNDVVAARAAWNPHVEAPSDEAALRALLEPVVRPFGSASNDIRELLIETARRQRELLIEGRVGGVPPDDIVRRNGQAYLQGVETWDDVSDLAGALPINPVQMTQPDRLGLVDMRNPLHAPPGYSAEVEPLLDEMEATLVDEADRYASYSSQVPDYARDLYDDMTDAARMTALRATQVHGLYDYVDGFWDFDPAKRLARLQTARDALDEAQLVVLDREKRYRVPADRIAGWRNNPTAYEFTYLWTVRSLFYWWRDEGKAVDAPLSPCYLNTINAVDVGFGEGLGVDAAGLAQDVADFAGLGAIGECLAEPDVEPTFPQDDLRSRP